MYTMAPQSICKVYFKNPSHHCLSVYPLIAARQRLGKNVTVATNTQAIEELLCALLYMRSVTYEGKQVISQLTAAHFVGGHILRN
jgi:hypothetical protein